MKQARNFLRRYAVKHFLKIPVLICLLSQNVWAELEIGQIPKTIELKYDLGGRLDGSPWSSGELKGKMAS
jgi:hypothetical protein